jgi:hypothetical protein
MKNILKLVVSITIIWIVVDAHFTSKHESEVAKNTVTIATLEGKPDLSPGGSGYSGEYGPVTIPAGAHFVWSVSCPDGTGMADFSVINPDGSRADLARVGSRYHAEGDVEFPKSGLVSIDANCDCPWRAQITQLR